MLKRVNFPTLYAMLDADALKQRGVAAQAFAEALLSAGVGIVQLRDKHGTPHQVLETAAMLREIFRGSDTALIMNDRPDLALLAGFDGVHVGQGDLSANDAKAIALKTRQESIVGVSTHTEDQVMEADRSPANYVAIGPVFATGTKADAAPVIGLEGVRRARLLTGKPLVAIGGITRSNAQSVIDAGADSVAVISGLFAVGEPLEKVARDFIDILR